MLHLQATNYPTPQEKTAPTAWFDWFDYDEPAWGMHLRSWNNRPNAEGSLDSQVPQDMQPSFLQCRFIPTKLRRSESAGVQISEIEFRSGMSWTSMERARADTFGGNSPVDEGPDKAIDGDRNTKWFDHSKGSLTITWNEAPRLASFRFVTANDYSGRDPVQWKFTCTRDKANWGLWHLQDKDYATPVVRRTPTEWFNLDFQGTFNPNQEEEDSKAWMGATFNVSDYVYEEPPAISDEAEYCFLPTKPRNEEVGVIEVSELEFRSGERMVTWPEGTIAKDESRDNADPDSANNAIDHNSSTKWVSMFPAKLCISPGSEAPMNITSFRFKTSDKFTGRDPVQWKFVMRTRGRRQNEMGYPFYGYISSTLLHSQLTDYAPPLLRNAPTEWFNFDLTAVPVNLTGSEEDSYHDLHDPLDEEV